MHRNECEEGKCKEVNAEKRMQGDECNDEHAEESMQESECKCQNIVLLCVWPSPGSFRWQLFDVCRCVIHIIFVVVLVSGLM